MGNPEKHRRQAGQPDPTDDDDYDIVKKNVYYVLIISYLLI